MVYLMSWTVDGGCRGNGSPGSVAAAAAILHKKYGKDKCYTKLIRGGRNKPEPTSQRAELAAIILALRKSLLRFDELEGYPELKVVIRSDSVYATKIMNKYVYRWVNNGWKNSRGEKVKNRDLIKKASDLDDLVKELGSVTYEWVSREHTWQADEACDEILDEVDEMSSVIEAFSGFALAL